MRLCVVVALTVVVFTSLSLGAGAAGGTVAAKDLRSLMLGPGDIPWDVILSDLNSEQKYVVMCPPAEKGALVAVSVDWSGPPIGGPGTRWAYSVTLKCVIYDSAASAGAAAEKLIGSFELYTPESHDKRSFPYADRAWLPGMGLITYTRKNVLVRVDSWGLGTDSEAATRRFALLVGRRIDAAAAGKPEPAPKLHQSDNWFPPSVYKSLSRPARNTILLKYKDRSAIPALVNRASDKDCLVALMSLAYAIAGKRSVKVNGDRVSATFGGRDMLFTNGSPIVKVGGKTIRLSRPIIVGPKYPMYRGGMVPLSLVEKVFGWHIRWIDGSKIKTAVIY